MTGAAPRVKLGDEGVSVVIGAMLLLAILVAAMIAFRMAYVPAAGEHAEVDHARDVSRAADSLTSQVREGARDADGKRASTPVPLGASYPFLVPGPPRSGAVAFEPGETTMELDAPRLTVHTRNGSAVGGGGGSSGSWKEVSGTETITDIHQVHALRINVTDPDPAHNETVSVEIQDRDGEYAGEFRLVIKRDPPDINLIAETRAPPQPATLVFQNHLLSLHQQNWEGPYWVDVMTPLFGFSTLLEQAKAPLTLTFAETGLEATFVISYTEKKDGLLRTVGGGVTIEPYNRAWSSGSITIDSPAAFFVHQERILEHGALILAQQDGATFQTEPPIGFRSASEFSKASLLLPAVQGSSFSVAGNERVEVKTTGETHQRLSAGAPELTVTLGTEFPGLWVTYLEEELATAGLSPPGDYELSANSTHVSLTLTGPSTDPNENDVSVTLTQANLQAEVTR